MVRSMMVLVAVTLLGAPDRGSSQVIIPDPDLTADSARTPVAGSFRALTYNVAGLPPGLSKSRPLQNTPRISRLLGSYDLALVQEDFFFHSLLASAAGHAHKSEPQRGSRVFSREFLDMLRGFPKFNIDGILGMVSGDRVTSDGLNRFSHFPFTDHERQTWASCSGLTAAANDCLATKGFTFARHELAPGVTLDVYNVHADAGRRTRDEEVRRAQFRQLAAFMALHSVGQPVIVGGDTNLQSPVQADEETIQEFMATMDLEIAARTLGQQDAVDRFFYRGSTSLELVAVSRKEAEAFVDEEGKPLSDHPAIEVEFRWTLRTASEAIPPRP